MKNKRLGLAYITCNDSQWPEGWEMKDADCPTIFVTRLPGETAQEIKEKLDKALVVLPFKTIYNEVHIFEELVEVFQFNDKFSVAQIKDYPGAKKAKVGILIERDCSFYLPRDSKTGEFTNIEEQVQCLSVLMELNARELWVKEGKKFIPRFVPR